MFGFLHFENRHWGCRQDGCCIPISIIVILVRGPYLDIFLVLFDLSPSNI